MAAPDGSTDRLMAADGTSLFRHRWPTSEPRAAVCLVHGLGEHGGRYRHVARWMNERGVALSGMDLRGHGRSPGRRGHAPSWTTLLDDVDALLHVVREEASGIPIFLYGHSLGGALVIDHALHRGGVAGAIATSPVLRPAFEPPGWKVRIGRMAGRVLPRLSFANEVDTAALARDPEVERRYLSDSLVHDRITAALGVGVLDAGERCLAHADRLRVPLLVMHGDADRIASPAASREFAARAGDRCTLRIWTEGYHELHNDPEWQDLLAETLAWMLVAAP